MRLIRTLAAVAVAAGVTTSTLRYVTIPAGGATVLARIARRNGRVLGSRVLAGNFTIPAVAYDGSAGSFPRAYTTFAVVDTRTLRTRRLVELNGDFSFDAVSREGLLLYFIQYVSP